MTNNGQPDESNVQGLIMRGYTHPFSCHMLFSFTNSNQSLNTKAFFKTLYPLVQSAEDWGAVKPKMMLNIGLTADGIDALNVTTVSDFPWEFQVGPNSSGSQDSLDDVGASDPSGWWHQNFLQQDLHCVVHGYALTQPDLDKLITLVTAAAKKNGLRELFAFQDNKTRLTQYEPLGDDIHFGFHDGISEPALNWNDGCRPLNQSDLNNFLIGYPTNSIIQPGPVNSSTASVQSSTVVDAATFAKDGCYNAFRILYQDVAAFNTLLEQQAAPLMARLGLSQEQAQEWIAAKLMGRWRNGSPLMLSPNAPDPKTSCGEDFGYVDPDDPNPNHDILSGNKCPFSAHTRVGNPRDEDLSAPADAAIGPPRIIRRGMPYGPTLTKNQDDGVDRGLIGLFLCGSPTQQFEKLYGWFNGNDFSSVFAVGQPPGPPPPPAPQDAVLGNRDTANLYVTTSFLIPMPDGNDITFNLPSFLITRGTAYFLLPSLSSIRLIAGL